MPDKPSKNGIDVWDMRCAICNKKVNDSGIYVIVSLPDGKDGFVCATHHGVTSLIHDILQLIEGKKINEVAADFKMQTTCLSK